MTDREQYPEVCEHYRTADEDGRLESSPQGRLESLRTRRTLRRFLPDPPAVVYDIGGGTGPYARWLASLGYTCHLIDLVPEHVERARQSGEIASCSVGDARSLDVAAGVADAALLLGPLYHLPERDDRVACWREAARIVRPGGIVAGAIISRFASLLDGLSRDLVADPAFREMLDRDLETGVHRNRTDNPEYFTTAYFHRPSDAESECTEAGLEALELVGLEGPAWLVPDLAARMDDEQRRDQLLGWLEKVEGEPSLIGVSAHSLVVGRKPS